MEIWNGGGKENLRASCIYIFLRNLSIIIIIINNITYIGDDHKHDMSVFVYIHIHIYTCVYFSACMCVW